MSEPDAAQVTLQSLRERIDALEKERLGRGLGSVGMGLGIAVVLLTAMGWARSPNGTTTATLWDLAEDSGWHGTVTVLTTVLLGVCSIAVSMKAQPSRRSLRIMVGLSAAVTALMVAASSMMPIDHTTFGYAVAHSSGPARWLTLGAALALLLTYAARLGQLRDAT